MKRSLCILLFVAVALPALAQQPGAPAATPAVRATPAATPAPELDWYDVTKFALEGREFGEMERLRWFDRLPAEAEKKVTPAVWGLSRDSAGMVFRFKTDAASIWAKYKLLKSAIAQPHMPATGVSGIDLYARDPQGAWRWVNVTKPAAQEVKVAIDSGLAPGEREYAAYLPLYNGVDALSIGVPKGRSLRRCRHGRSRWFSMGRRSRMGRARRGREWCIRRSSGGSLMCRR